MSSILLRRGKVSRVHGGGLPGHLLEKQSPERLQLQQPFLQMQAFLATQVQSLAVYAGCIAQVHVSYGKCCCPIAVDDYDYDRLTGIVLLTSS